MRRAFAVVAALGVLGIALAGALHAEHRAFSLGVTSVGVAAQLKQGQSVCQGLIEVPQGGAFDAVRMPVGTFHRPGPALEVTVRTPQGRQLAQGTLEGGYPDIDRQPFQVIGVGHVADRQPIDVCIENQGRHSAALYGNSAAASAHTTARDGKGTPLPSDLDLIFVRDDAPSQLALVPDMLRRAALFAAGGVGAWVLWLGLVLVVVLVPVALWRAIGAAVADEPGTAQDG